MLLVSRHLRVGLGCNAAVRAKCGPSFDLPEPWTDYRRIYRIYCLCLAKFSTFSQLSVRDRFWKTINHASKLLDRAGLYCGYFLAANTFFDERTLALSQNTWLGSVWHTQVNARFLHKSLLAHTMPVLFAVFSDYGTSGQPSFCTNSVKRFLSTAYNDTYCIRNPISDFDFFCCCLCLQTS
jgi:hypothetical protein